MNNHGSYRLYSQHSDGRIILENITTKQYISTTASEIISDPKMIKLLSEKDMKIIRFIANERTFKAVL